MPKKAVENFLSTIINNCDGNNGNRVWRYKLDLITKKTEEMTYTQICNIVSDKFWNKYPTYRYWKTRAIDDMLSHASFLHDMVSFVITNKADYPKLYKAIVNESQGIIHYLAIKNVNGSILKRVAKRGIISSDSRVRKQSARILPIGMIIPLATDKNYGVVAIAANRIGVSAMPELFINSKYSEYRLKAIKSVDMTKDEIGSKIDHIIENINDGGSVWYKRKEITSLLDKLDKNDLLYFFHITKYLQLHEYFNQRIGS